MRTDPNDRSGFVQLSDVIPDAIQEIRYHSAFNFIGERIAGYEQPVALLTREAAEALKGAADELRKRGFLLKVFDAYRPQSAVDHFVRWAEDTGDTRMKEYFYPDVDKRDLFRLGYIAVRSGHSRGSTVDCTLFDLSVQREADLGGTFDRFGEISGTYRTEGLTEEQLRLRAILRGAMLENGFRGIGSEWWHFTLLEEPYPDTYFTFPVRAE